MHQCAYTRSNTHTSMHIPPRTEMDAWRINTTAAIHHGIGEGAYLRLGHHHRAEHELEVRGIVHHQVVSCAKMFRCKPTGWPNARDALEEKGPRRQPQKRLDRRSEAVGKAVAGSFCRLQMPLKLALGVRETVAGHRLGALERGTFPPSNASLDGPTPMVHQLQHGTILLLKLPLQKKHVQGLIACLPRNKEWPSWGGVGWGGVGLGGAKKKNA